MFIAEINRQLNFCDLLAAGDAEHNCGNRKFMSVADGLRKKRVIQADGCKKIFKFAASYWCATIA